MRKSESMLAALEMDFKAKVSADLTKVDFAEAGQPIYIRKSYSSFRKAPILKAAQENRMDDFNALMIIQLAVDEDGSWLFLPGNKDHLVKKVDSAVLDRVAFDILQVIKLDDDDEPELAVAEKNSVSEASYTSNSSSQTA